MRIVQNVLLVIGAAALGIVLCGLGLACVATVTLFRSRPGSEPGLNWGAAYGFFGCGSCGSVFGIILGIVMAVRWIGRHEDQRWAPIVWIGIAAGLLVALPVRFSEALNRFGIIGDLIHWWGGTIIFLIASGAVGGILAGFIGGQSSPSKSKPRRRKRPPSLPSE